MQNIVQEAGNLDMHVLLVCAIHLGSLFILCVFFFREKVVIAIFLTSVHKIKSIEQGEQSYYSCYLPS